MAGAQGLANGVHRFFQRLYLSGGHRFAVVHGLHRQVNDLADGAAQHLKLPLGLVTEVQLFVPHFGGALGHVDGVVANALHLGHEGQQAVRPVALHLAQLPVADLDQVVGQGDLHPVDQVLPLVHHGGGIVFITGQQRHGGAVVAGGTGRHLLHRVLGLLNGHGRAGEQALVQHRHGEILLLAGLVPHGVLRQPDQHLGEGDEADGGHHAGQRVNVCNAALVQDLIPEGHADGALDEVNARQEHHRADEVEVQVDDRTALGPLGRAHRRHHRGEGGADVGAQNDGKGVAPGDHAGTGQRLQNAHAGRRTLDCHGDGQTGQQAQNRVLELGEQVHEQRRLPQARHGGFHLEHTGEQDAEAHHDLAQIALFGGLVEHIQDHAHKRHHRREGLGLNDGQQQAVAADVRQSNELTRHGGADVGAHDHAHGLRQGHNARVDQTDDDDDGTGTGLNDAGDEGTQKNAPDGGGGELLQNALHLSARDLFQAGAHDGHAIQEQRHASGELNHIGYCQKTTPIFRLGRSGLRR